ncbi:MAG: hypothetical protein FJX75_26725 [Armatimonadetes bacterium]|nr:hypothetical protein [Armatimonadota bacterium]
MAESERPMNFAWVGSREGISSEVLAPWSALQAEETDDSISVKCWGRRYDFATGPFPRAIETAGSEVLAAPVRVRAAVDGEPVGWEGCRPHLVEARADHAILEATCTGAGLELSARTCIEYDGMVRLDLALQPTRELELTELTFEVPLRAEHARYFYWFTGKWELRENAGLLPPEGLVGGFRPLVWLGDEERGLAWFCESDEHWRPRDPERVTRVEARGGQVILHLGITEEPARLSPGEPPLRFTFGLQATPVKPNPETVWDWRICHGGDYGIERLDPEAPATLRYPAEGNFDLAQGTLELRVQPLFDTECPPRHVSLFTLQLPKGDGFRWFCPAGEPRMRLVLNQQQDHVVDLSAAPRWESGRFHHVALTWGEAVRVYHDGELLGVDPRHGSLVASLQGGALIFGGPGARWLIGEVRVSDIARTPQEIAAAAAGGPFALDEHVVLLDRLDEAFEPGSIEHLDGGYGGYSGTMPVRAAGDWGWQGKPGGIVGLGRFREGDWGRALELGLDKPPLDHFAELGVRTICIHEQWTDFEGYTSTTHAEKLRSLARACHERGMRLLVYFGFLLSDLAPEWPVFGDEVVVEPRRVYDPYDYPPQPHQLAYWVCYRSQWQDQLADGIAKLMDEFDVDGVYLDGTASPPPCSNERHGCGYVRPDGSRAVTYPIFATRDMMRRIYTVVKSRKPDGLVSVHQSTCMTIPTLAWATSLWDGEQFCHLERGPAALETIPLDAFRVEFMGHQWGVPGEFLCYDRPYTYEQACAFTLLHDVLVRPNGLGPHLELASKLWRLSDYFGRREAEWLPYWRNAEYVTVSPPGALASLYHHPREGVLIVVSNLAPGAAEVSVRLNAERLGLGRDAQTRDGLTGEGVALRDHGFTVRLDSMDWRIIWVR